MLLVLVHGNKRTAARRRRRTCRLTTCVDLLQCPLITVPEGVPDGAGAVLVDEVLLVLVHRNKWATARRSCWTRGLPAFVDLLLAPLIAVPKRVTDSAGAVVVGEVLLVLVHRHEWATAQGRCRPRRLSALVD